MHSGNANTFSPPLDPFMSDRLDTGQETIHRMLATSTGTLSSGSLRLAFFTARKAELIAKIRTISGTAAGATPSLCRVGLFSVANTGALTLVASIPNTPSLWAAATTAYETALSVPYTPVAGNRYAVGTLCVTAAAAPTISIGVAISTAGEGGQSPRLSGIVTGQTDLPASIAAASISDSSNRPYAVLLAA